MPSFVRCDPITGRLWLVQYEDSDPSDAARESLLPGSESSLRPDVLHGDRAAEITLDRLIH